MSLSLNVVEQKNYQIKFKQMMGFLPSALSKNKLKTLQNKIRWKMLTKNWSYYREIATDY